MTIAELRRRLPNGQSFKISYPGSGLSMTDQHRTVMVQSLGRMVSIRPNGERVRLDWRGVTAEERHKNLVSLLHSTSGYPVHFATISL